MRVESGFLSSSFRDPSGHLFRQEGLLFRQVNVSYKDNYDTLMGSGLYEELVAAGLMVPHEKAHIDAPDPRRAYLVIKPEIVPFISYPYEWCFGQLKDAALATLEIQRRALGSGMSLKDSSAYNIQFFEGKPVLIDTLSFEKYEEGCPWIAYGQFLRHFLAPLALMRYKDMSLSQLLRIHIDGIPVGLASTLLPALTRFRPSLFLNLHLLARSEKRYADKPVDVESARRVSKKSLLALIEGLRSAVARLKWEPEGTVWADYYDETNYSEEGLVEKGRLVGEFLDHAAPGTVWDLGANTGLFSRIASERGALVVSIDNDPACVERNYLDCIKVDEKNILPLVIDLSNPSSGIGWENRERMSLEERGPADAALALALIHHLAIANNVPLGMAAKFFSRVCEWLIIEFVPKTDSQVQRLLSSREDIFEDYTQETFEAEFSRLFTIEESVRIPSSKRTLYLMRRKQA